MFEEDLKKDETTAGKEFQAAIAGAGANILEGVANLLTIPVDYAFDTSFTKIKRRNQKICRRSW